MFGGITLFLSAYLIIAAICSIFMMAYYGENDYGYDHKFAPWIERHPYHFLFNWYNKVDNVINPGPILTGVVFILFVVINMFYFLTGFLNEPAFQWHLWPYILAGAGAYPLVALIYRLYKNRGAIKARFGKLWQRIKDWHNVPKEKDELSQAKASRKRLLALIKDEKHKKALWPILENINQLIAKELPNLIKRRKQLALFVNNADDVIKKQQNNGIVPGEETLLEQSGKEFDVLKAHQQSVEIRIAFILSFLDLISTKVSLIIDQLNDDDTVSAEKLINMVQNQLNEIIKANDDVNALLSPEGLYGEFDSALQAAQAAEEAGTGLPENLKAEKA